uniref:Uncharacterized protein n=1 Tax=Romanomermis culicivorax TaxID=13658 RepID=A0A915JG10_ROMCU
MVENRKFNFLKPKPKETDTPKIFDNETYIDVMQKCNAEMINFRGDATKALSKIVTIVTQQ